MLPVTVSYLLLPCNVINKFLKRKKRVTLLVKKPNSVLNRNITIKMTETLWFSNFVVVNFIKIVSVPRVLSNLLLSVRKSRNRLV